MTIASKIRLTIAALTTMLLSCTADFDIINKIIDAEFEPDLIVENLETFHFDSARLQARLVTPIMKQYTSASDKRQEFPQGLYVWIYETSGELRADITADWARYDLDATLWETRYNVVVTTVAGEKIETEQLFWDRRNAIFYSEKYTKVTQSNGNMASGETFWANQDFSIYRFPNKSGIGSTVIYVNDDENGEDEEN